MNQTEIDNLNITKITIWLDKHNITQYSIRKENMDFYVDVHDSVNLSDSKISHIPFKFGVIDNDFCIDNNLLTSCESLPQIVKKDFSIHNNKIENFEKSNIKEIFGIAVMSSNQINDLENIPIVHSYLNLNHNKLTSLKHLPECISGTLSVSKNLLTNLDYLPLLIKGDFVCAFNKVSSFSDLQKTTILGSLIMEYNNLTNCINIPKVYNSIDLSHNFITTLQGLNHQTLDSLNLNFNQLTSLEFCPNTIKTSLLVNYNQLKNFSHIGENMNEIYVQHNQINSFLGLEKTNFSLLVANNNKIKSFKHLPHLVKGHLCLEENLIKSFYASPKVIKGDLIVSNNKISSLKNVPDTIHGDLIVSHNPLTTVDHLPSQMTGYFIASFPNFLNSDIETYSLKEIEKVKIYHDMQKESQLQNNEENQIKNKKIKL